MAIAATAEAWKNAGLSQCNLDPERIGCTVSASKPLFMPSSPTVVSGGSMDSPLTTAGNDDFRVVPSDEILRSVRRRFGFQGESRNVIAACATGAYSIAIAASWIEHGLCDVVVAGSVEPLPHPLIEAGFRQMGVTSNDGFTRPFDQNRSGFTFGEGAGIVVLESETFARNRGVSVLGHLSGWALGADSHSAVAFNSQGSRIASVIERALAKSREAKESILHLNAHGTATRLNDWIETQALQKAFGNHAKQLMISATKGSTGHLLGASGSVEFIFTLLALRHQFIPPTATLESADPECSLDYTPRLGHSADFRHAMSLSFGFGGPIAVLVVSAC